MASTSEVGHVKNVANINAIYQILEEMGTLYNPSNNNTKPQNLNPIKTELQNTINNLDTKIPLYKNAVATREQAIKPLNKIITQTLNYAKSIEISAIDKKNIENRAKKLRGFQKKSVINPSTASTDAISTSPISYDSRIANLNAYYRATCIFFAIPTQRNCNSKLYITNSLFQFECFEPNS